MFKKKLLLGHSEDTVLAIIEHIEKSNIPCEIGIKDIFKRSSEVYEALFTVKVKKKYAKQVEAIVAQYVSQEELKHWYEIEKKKRRKLERKGKAFDLFVFFIGIIALAAINIGKSGGPAIFLSLGSAVLLIGGVFITTKYYKAIEKEWGDLIFGITLILYAVYSFISVLRF